MIVTAWVLLSIFGLFSITGLYKYFLGDGVTDKVGAVLILAVFIVALSAGVIWGGLFR